MEHNTSLEGLLDNPHGEEFFLRVHSEPHLLLLCAIHVCPVPITGEEELTLPFVLPFHGGLQRAMILCLGHLFCKLDNRSALSLSLQNVPSSLLISFVTLLCLQGP